MNVRIALGLRVHEIARRPLAWQGHVFQQHTSQVSVKTSRLCAELRSWDFFGHRGQCPEPRPLLERAHIGAPHAAERPTVYSGAGGRALQLHARFPLKHI